MITFLDTLLQSTALKSSGPAHTDYLFVRVRVMIMVKVRILKIRNKDIRNQKPKQKNNPVRSRPLFLRSTTFGCTLILCDPFLHFTFFCISFNLMILYDYVASIKIFLIAWMLLMFHTSCCWHKVITVYQKRKLIIIILRANICYCNMNITTHF